MRKRWLFILLVIGVLVAACAGDPEVVEVTRVVTETEVVEGEAVEVTRVVSEEVAVEVTRVVTEIVEATPEPVDRNGAWLDTIVVIEEPNASAGVERVIAGDIDVYAFPIADPDIAARIDAAEGLNTAVSYGGYNEITFNPAALSEGGLNPFTSPKIREAMNWLIDRDFIIQEILGGLGVARYVPINGASADRARLATEIRAIEAKYGYDPERAEAVITEEMEALGATLDGGVWTYEGEPVTLIGLIRTEDERLQIGDYVANQLEDIGFTVTRDYKTSAEASPCWLRGDPASGCFSFYTGGWISTAISLDAGTNFNFFYTAAGLPFPLWQAYTPTEEFATVAQRLNDNDFSNLEERTELFAQALPLALEDSARVWLFDSISVAPYSGDVSVSADLSANIYGSNFWQNTLRFTDEVGGSMTWAMQSILTEPWNPLAGSNWIYDMALIRAIGEVAAPNDPATGLNLPNRYERAELAVQEGLPVGKTLDWVDLQFVSENVVPDDAWVDWNAADEVFITAAEKFTETQTALMKATVYYPADVFDKVTWHDGSHLSMGDMVMRFIQVFDQAKEDSPVYDEATVSNLDAFLSSFKGLRIVSQDPVTIEYYSDQWSLDAEEFDYNAFGNLSSLWPMYAQGSAAWHNLTLGLLAEEKGLAAHSPGKSEELEVEELNYIAGPTVEIMKEQLDEAMEAGYLPYAATLSQYISADEIAERYQNLSEFFRRRGHFWLGTGPYFLQRAFPVEGTVILERYPDFPDAANRWARFSAPAVAEVGMDGPARVTSGDEAVFDVFVDFAGEAYAVDDIKQVKYLLFDATGELAGTGEAEAVADGLWQVTLGEDITSALEAGSNRLEVVVVSRLVALPSLGQFQFVTAP